jgi:hypothetical protein
MQINFDDIICKIIQIYLDDLTVYSKNRQDHFDNLKEVLLHCRTFDISINPSKYVFGVTQGKLLGHIVFDSEINIDPERVTAILSLQVPSSKNKIQSFMGRINFVRRFVPNFAVMVNPIHNMLKHDQYLSWNEDVEKDFVGIKKQ